MFKHDVLDVEAVKAIERQVKEESVITNEQWLKTLNKEESAEWFAKTKFFKGDTTVEEFAEWLRSEHNED